MSATADSIPYAGSVAGDNKHPRGLYVLFGTEMWERFSFYSMLALFTLYLQNPDEGFGWSAARATGLLTPVARWAGGEPISPKSCNRSASPGCAAG